MNRNILLLICSTISVATIYASPYTRGLDYKGITGLAVCTSHEVQLRVDKLADEVAGVLVNAIKSAPLTKEEAKLGKEFAGIAKAIIAIERQETQATGQKLKLAGLNLKGYVAYKKLVSMMHLRAELTKALLNELQKPGVIENIVTQAHELARFVLEAEDVGAREAGIQELCDLVSQDQIKKLCIGTLSHIYERSVRPSPSRNNLLASGLALKLKQYFDQVDLACKKCVLGIRIPQETWKALSALVFRMEARMYDAVEQALHAKS
jgi:hypothetical protein